MIRQATARIGPGYQRRRLGQILGPLTSIATGAIASWMGSIQLSHNADSATTAIVNGLAVQLQNLLNAYLADPPSCDTQRAALDAYDQAWAWLQSPAACGNPAYGSAGNRCISDRAPTGPRPWATYYRDPIANDPRLAGMHCDTSQEVLLPSLSTGTYAATGITAAGGADITTAAGTPPAAITAAPAAIPGTGLTIGSTTISPTVLILAALGVGALALSK
jgi:hypothetical protein